MQRLRPGAAGEREVRRALSDPRVDAGVEQRRVVGAVGGSQGVAGMAVAVDDPVRQAAQKLQRTVDGLGHLGRRARRAASPRGACRAARAPTARDRRCAACRGRRAASGRRRPRRPARRPRPTARGSRRGRRPRTARSAARRPVLRRPPARRSAGPRGRGRLPSRGSPPWRRQACCDRPRLEAHEDVGRDVGHFAACGGEAGAVCGSSGRGHVVVARLHAGHGTSVVRVALAGVRDEGDDGRESAAAPAAAVAARAAG